MNVQKPVNPPQGFRGDTLPEIMITDRPMKAISEDALSALRQFNVPPHLYVRAGSMVHIVADEHQRSRITTVDAPFLRGRMDRTATFVRMTRNGGIKPASPPSDVVADILALPPETWGLPPLENLIELPLLRPDGSVLTEPGYDTSTGLFYQLTPGLEIPSIPDCPDRIAIAQSLETIDEALAEFPFENDGSYANTLALLLTPLVRMAIDGPVPLALIDAPQPGTGKSLLASVVAAVTTGTPAAMTSIPREEEEWRKAITAILLGGATVIIYDNLQQVLQSSSLAMALTAQLWKDRILGHSQSVTIPQKATWVITGNNIRLGGDLARRCYRIRLNSKMSRPWTRSGFRHPDLIRWVLDNRGRLVAALLTLARGWFAAGKPDLPVPRVGSFEAWAGTVGSILAYAGVPGFLGNLDRLYELADETTAQWECFLEALHELYGPGCFTVAELVIELASNKNMSASLPEELGSAWGERDTASKGFHIKLGKALRGRVDTRYGATGLHIQRAGSESRGGQVKWTVIPAGMQESQMSNRPTHGHVSEVVSEESGGTNLQNLQTCDADEQPVYTDEEVGTETLQDW